MTDIKFSLIEIDGKPAEKLIESVGSAIGVAYEPIRIKRKAKADAEALLIKKKTEIRAKELEGRTRNRLNTKELRRQKNIEAIVKESVKQLPNSVNKRSVNEDWIYQFFNECQDVGNKEMQLIWSKVLANEVAEPDSFSYKTLNVVKLLSAEEAKLFSRICNYTWEFNGVKKLVKPPEPLTELYKLEVAGLINIKNDFSGFVLRGSMNYKLTYFDKTVLLSSTDDKDYLGLGMICFTRAGKELLSIISTRKKKLF